MLRPVNCKFAIEIFLMTSFRRSHPLIKIINGALVDIPIARNLRTFWNFGSLLGLCLTVQLATGLFLAMQYSGNILLAFRRVRHLQQDVLGGWLLRTIHANGARFFFFCIYLHIGRGLYYGSYVLDMVWNVGVIILLLVIAAAFFGYVLPWGQISFWGTSVITNLLSAIPAIGGELVFWLWGGFSVGGPTLTRFFTFHFLVPFIVAALASLHLLFLHQHGSRNPLGASSSFLKSPFHPYFSRKDLTGLLMILLLLGTLALFAPWRLGDPENFIPANPLVTPIHIQPEWYFLFAYAILRSIPNKLGGVVALALAILILLTLSFNSHRATQGLRFYPISQAYFWSLVIVVFLLTIIGARPVEEPFVFIGQLLAIYYFLFFFLFTYTQLFWDKISS